MLRTYRAILTGTQIEWVGEPPLEIGKNKPVDIEVKVLSDSIPTKTSLRGRRMAEVLEKLSKRLVVQDIEDPVAWQRESRKDRILPGR
jgi:hypothetical protein